MASIKLLLIFTYIILVLFDNIKGEHRTVISNEIVEELISKLGTLKLFDFKMENLKNKKTDKTDKKPNEEKKVFIKSFVEFLLPVAKAETELTDTQLEDYLGSTGVDWDKVLTKLDEILGNTKISKKLEKSLSTAALEVLNRYSLRPGLLFNKLLPIIDRKKHPSQIKTCELFLLYKFAEELTRRYSKPGNNLANSKNKFEPLRKNAEGMLWEYYYLYRKQLKVEVVERDGEKVKRDEEEFKKVLEEEFKVVLVAIEKILAVNKYELEMEWLSEYENRTGEEKNQLKISRAQSGNHLVIGYFSTAMKDGQKNYYDEEEFFKILKAKNDKN